MKRYQKFRLLNRISWTIRFLSIIWESRLPFFEIRNVRSCYSVIVTFIEILRNGFLTIHSEICSTQEPKQKSACFFYIFRKGVVICYDNIKMSKQTSASSFLYVQKCSTNWSKRWLKKTRRLIKVILLLSVSQSTNRHNTNQKW